MPIGVITKGLPKTFAMTMISVLTFIGAVGSDQPTSAGLLAATMVTGSTVESIDSTGLGITVHTAWTETICLCWS